MTAAHMQSVAAMVAAMGAGQHAMAAAAAAMAAPHGRKRATTARSGSGGATIRATTPATRGLELVEAREEARRQRRRAEDVR